MELNNKDLDYKSAREEIHNFLERKRESSQRQVRAMEVGELNAQSWDNEYVGYSTYDGEGDENHSMENGLNMIYASKGQGKGYWQKGNTQIKGNSYTKGWGNVKGWQQGNTKGWQNNAGDARTWAGQESKGKGKSKGKGF